MFPSVCVAGTFDPIHAGHEILLAKAFESGERVLVGITSDTYTKTYKPAVVRPYSDRHADMLTHLGTRGWMTRATVIPIDDPYEPAASDPTLSAIVVSEYSATRAEEINRMRQDRGVPPLRIITVPMIRAKDAKPVSSTRVRNGEIDIRGNLLMPNAMREELGKPLGPVYPTESLHLDPADRIVTVGDMTTKTVLDRSIVPTMMIIDGKTERKTAPDLTASFDRLHIPVVRVSSGPGFISREAIHAIRMAFDAPSGTAIFVDGEEDLLALPAIIEAPVGTRVLYGQPVAQGVVVVMVTDRVKESVQALMSRFTLTGQ